MKRIHEVIIVEGKHDSQRLKQFFECDTLETGGLALDDDFLSLVKLMQKRRGVIIFTDPDSPGNRIRNKINEAVEGCKNAFVMKNDAKTEKKVGIEHASKEILEEALSHLISYDEEGDSLNAMDMMELGLSGQIDSVKKREKVAEAFHIGMCSAKTMRKRLNYAKIKKEEIEEVLK
ncbi:MAG: ribonuclease M5 [Solobacterium sp.]|nr:ribonuclease M5 [Solobacterium sp.]